MWNIYGFVEIVSRRTACVAGSNHQTLECRDGENLAKARVEIQAIAQRDRISLQDLAKSRAARKKSGTAAVQYRNPSDAEQHWTGRGRQPRWVKE